MDSSSQIRGKLIAVSKKDHTRVEESSSCVRGCRDQGEIMGDPGRSWESGWASDKVGDEVAVSDDEGVELLGVEVLDPHVWAASPIERISRGLHRKPPSAEWCRLLPPSPHRHSPSAAARAKRQRGRRTQPKMRESSLHCPTCWPLRDAFVEAEPECSRVHTCTQQSQRSSHIHRVGQSFSFALRALRSPSRGRYLSCEGTCSMLIRGVVFRGLLY